MGLWVRAVRASLLRLSFALAVALAGCGTADAAVDAATPDASVDAGIAAPSIPWLAAGTLPVVLTPCPSGWREVVEEDLTLCEPYPDPLPDCAPGEELFVGEAGCMPVGDPCPAGDFHDGLPATGVLYVLSTAAPGGDGSLASPYASIADVEWRVLPAATTVAIAKGTYVGALALHAGIHVVGACAAETIIRPSAAASANVVSVTTSGQAASLSGVTIRDPPYIGVAVDGRRALVLDGVVVEGGTVGLLVRGVGAQVTATRLVLRGGIRGVSADGGARLEASRVSIEGTHEVALAASDADTFVALTDAAVRDGADVSGSFGGIHVQMGARVEGTRMVVSNLPNGGAIAVGAGSTLVLVDSVVRDMHPYPSFGLGIEVTAGALLQATRVVVSDNHFLGISVSDAESRAELSHVVARRTGTIGTDSSYGYGIQVQDGASLDANALLVSENHAVGIGVLGSGTTARLTDAVVRGSVPSESGFGGRGIELIQGARATATRVLVRNTYEAGVVALDAATDLTLEDVVIEGTRLGVGTLLGSDTLAFGIIAQGSAAITATRVTVEDADAIGVVAFTFATIRGQDVTVRHVLRTGVRPFGHGVAAIGGSVDLTSFVVSDVAMCGLLVAPSPTFLGTEALDVRIGLVQHASVGACIQASPYDAARLGHDVAYRDNGTNLASTSLPVPDPLESVGL